MLAHDLVDRALGGTARFVASAGFSSGLASFSSAAIAPMGISAAQAASASRDRRPPVALVMRSSREFAEVYTRRRRDGSPERTRGGLLQAADVVRERLEIPGAEQPFVRRHGGLVAAHQAGLRMKD